MISNRIENDYLDWMYGMMCEGGTYAEELCKDCPMNQVFLAKDDDFHF